MREQLSQNYLEKKKKKYSYISISITVSNLYIHPFTVKSKRKLDLI